MSEEDKIDAQVMGAVFGTALITSIVKAAGTATITVAQLAPPVLITTGVIGAAAVGYKAYKWDKQKTKRAMEEAKARGVVLKEDDLRKMEEEHNKKVDEIWGRCTKASDQEEDETKATERLTLKSQEECEAKGNKWKGLIRNEHFFRAGEIRIMEEADRNFHKKQPKLQEGEGAYVYFGMVPEEGQGPRNGFPLMDKNRFTADKVAKFYGTKSFEELEELGMDKLVWPQPEPGHNASWTSYSLLTFPEAEGAKEAMDEVGHPDAAAAAASFGGTFAIPVKNKTLYLANPRFFAQAETNYNVIKSLAKSDKAAHLAWERLRGKVHKGHVGNTAISAFKESGKLTRLRREEKKATCKDTCKKTCEDKCNKDESSKTIMEEYEKESATVEQELQVKGAAQKAALQKKIAEKKRLLDRSHSAPDVLQPGAAGGKPIKKPRRKSRRKSRKKFRKKQRKSLKKTRKKQRKSRKNPLNSRKKSNKKSRK